MKQNLHRFYNDDAFLCNHDYFQALCVCLEAVDKNQSSLLTNIDHSLISRGRSSTSSSSSPYTPRSRTHTQPTDPLTQELTSSTVSLRSKTEPAMTPAKKWAESSRMSQDSVTLDNILNNEEKTHNSNTHPTNQKKVSKGKQPMKGHQSNLWTAWTGRSSRPACLIRTLLWLIGYTMCPESSFLTQPSPGESLKSYLSSQDFDTCAELDRENAHFAISEALIAAIEYMKWNQVLRPAEPPLLENLSQLEDSELESDEEIVKLKQRIKEKKKQRFMKKHGLASEKSSSGATPKSSSHSNSIRDSDSMFSEEDEYNSSAPSDTDSLLTLRDGLLFTDRLSDSGLSSNINPSADQVALSLLSQFNEYHLPKADELVWLVSEKEAPQALLPLPDSLPISPDDMMEGRKGTRIRGNADWAPPRPQIIFNIHPNPGYSILPKYTRLLI
ncbi:KIAA0226 [Bugula neritina]|uniref:KIAA0226 n=1 Tax=Bugula neritina TaxID=10212 RepID=A0A7J7J620_BUGNE|nr:KIAA0226 [Bugula neritina]